MPMATCVHNGNNETNIGLSQSIALSFSNNYENEIEIKDSAQLIDIWIPREVNLPDVNPNFVNLTGLENNKNNSEKQELFPIGLKLETQNSSIHIEISPFDSSVGYLVLLKFNMTPRINSKFGQDYHNWKLFCPAGKFFIFK
jgi:hypothetical protein